MEQSSNQAVYHDIDIDQSADQGVYHEIIESDVDYQAVNRQTTAVEQESGQLQHVNHVDHIHEPAASVSIEQQQDTVQLPVRVTSRTTPFNLHST